MDDAAGNIGDGAGDLRFVFRCVTDRQLVHEWIGCDRDDTRFIRLRFQQDGLAVLEVTVIVNNLQSEIRRVDQLARYGVIKRFHRPVIIDE